MKFRCPQCGSTMEGDAGAELVCSQCGFKATVPLDAPAPPPATAPSAAPLEPAIKNPAMWAYLASLLAIGTFFLSAYGIPFLLAVVGIGVGFWSNTRNRADRRGLIAVVLGIVALFAAAIFLAFA